MENSSSTEGFILDFLGGSSRGSIRSSHILIASYQDHKRRFAEGGYEDNFTFSYLEEMRRRGEDGVDMGSFGY